MKKSIIQLNTCALLVALTALVGCDWSSGSGDNNFNLSGSASLTNISGFYRGTFGGRAVENTSNGNINNFTIQQSGNRIEIVDNQGSTYTGSVGSPLYVIPEGSTTLSSGAEVATYQVSFTGRDGVAAKDIEFTGVISLVTVTDVQGNTTTSGSDHQDNNTVTTTTTTTNSIPQQVGVDGVEPGVDQSSTETSEQVNNQNSSNTQTTTFEITDASTQLRLTGTWTEIGGVTSSVDARSAGIQGNVTATTDP